MLSNQQRIVNIFLNSENSRGTFVFVWKFSMIITLLILHFAYIFISVFYALIANGIRIAVSNLRLRKVQVGFEIWICPIWLAVDDETVWRVFVCSPIKFNKKEN